MEGGAPSVIGRFELHRALASGGMATVHLGRMRASTGLSRTVALKRMHPHFATDPEFVAMFFDEARLAMRLQHPNIVPTFDIVSTDSELLLVMEYIHGESLAGLVAASAAAGERIPPAIASSIVGGVLAGLHAAHEARSEDGSPLEIVHRDVSPQNVMVGIDGTARLLDFGIAKAAGRVHSTAQGQVKGKFAYMAPEQLTAGDVDRRTDVFAAAVVLWETLTGERLFRGDTPAALVNAVLSSEISPPSAFVPGLPAAVDEVVMRGLTRQRRQRYATAREMAAALEAALPPATARAVGEWTEKRASASLAKRASFVKDVEGARPPDPRVVTRVNELSGRDEMPSGLPGEELSVAGVDAATVPAKVSRRAWSLGTVVVVLAVATGAVAMTRVAASPKVTANAQASPALSADPSTLVPAPPPSVASAPAPAPSPPVTRAPSSPPAARARPRPRAAPSKPDCSNPFVVDSRGLRVPRPECF